MLPNHVAYSHGAHNYVVYKYDAAMMLIASCCADADQLSMAGVIHAHTFGLLLNCHDAGSNNFAAT